MGIKRRCTKCSATCLPRPDGLCGDCRHAIRRKWMRCRVCDTRCLGQACGMCWGCQQEHGADALTGLCECGRLIPGYRDRCRVCRGEAVPA